jgi:predicted ABC-type ATPase
MELYIIAGPNGAGKTTFAREFLPNYADCKNFVNADLIAQGISPFSPELAALRAGRMMLTEIQSFANRRVSFAFETTLSGRSYIPLLRRLKAQGYEIHFFFLWLKSVDLALSRINASREAVTMCRNWWFADGSLAPCVTFCCTIANWRMAGLYSTTQAKSHR